MRLPLLILPILAGSIGLLTGTVAIAVGTGDKPYSRGFTSW
jgi:hypothetical protein